jgi:hypothetical protein
MQAVASTITEQRTLPLLKWAWPEGLVMVDFFRCMVLVPVFMGVALSPAANPPTSMRLGAIRGSPGNESRTVDDSALRHGVDLPAAGGTRRGPRVVARALVQVAVMRG